LAESNIGGPLNGITTTNSYDSLLRRSNLSILNPQSSILASAVYGFDAASRLQTVASGGTTTASVEGVRP
jgi:hypothetical protein